MGCGASNLGQEANSTARSAGAPADANVQAPRDGLKTGTPAVAVSRESILDGSVEVYVAYSDGTGASAALRLALVLCGAKKHGAPGALCAIDSSSGTLAPVEGAADSPSAVRFIIGTSVPPKPSKEWATTVQNAGKAVAIASGELMELAEQVACDSRPPMQKKLRPKLRAAVQELEQAVKSAAAVARSGHDEQDEDFAATGGWLFSSKEGAWGQNPTEADLWVIAALQALERVRAVRQWDALTGRQVDESCGPPEAQAVLKQGKAIKRALEARGVHMGRSKDEGGAGEGEKRGQLESKEGEEESKSGDAAAGDESQGMVGGGGAAAAAAAGEVAQGTADAGTADPSQIKAQTNGSGGGGACAELKARWDWAKLQPFAKDVLLTDEAQIVAAAVASGKVKMLAPLSAGRCQHESIRFWKAYCVELARIAAFGKGRGEDTGGADPDAIKACREIEGPLDSKQALAHLAKYYRLLTDLLKGHSEMEDDALYPAFEKRHPGMTAAPSADHEREIPMMQDLCGRIVAAAQADLEGGAMPEGTTQEVPAWGGQQEGSSGDTVSVLAGLFMEVDHLADAMEEHLRLEERTLFPLLKELNPKKDHPALFAAAFGKCDTYRKDLFPFVIAGMPGHWAGQYLFNVQRHMKGEHGDLADLDGHCDFIAAGEADERIQPDKVRLACMWAPMYARGITQARERLRAAGSGGAVASAAGEAQG